MFEELFHLLSQLGLGSAARPVCDLVADLVGESMSVVQLHQEILNVLHRHGGANCADAVISAMVELGFAGLSRADSDQRTNEAVGTATTSAATPGAAVIRDSQLLSNATNLAIAGTAASPFIIAEPRATRVLHETARGWLDIDGGIYFDLRQHGSRSD